jgi:acetolactate synthase-1/2/3 large subunit/5-guanidino-2-oxopentanoate decarboxylase
MAGRVWASGLMLWAEGDLDFQMLARAYGAAAARPASLRELEAAIKTALSARGPTLIEMTPDMARA